MPLISHPIRPRRNIIIGLLVIALLLQPQSITQAQTSTPVPPLNIDNLPAMIRDAVVTLKNALPTDTIVLYDVQTDGLWAAGMAMVAITESEPNLAEDEHVDGSPYIFPFVAYGSPAGWQVGVEYAATYLDLLKAAPRAVLSPVHLASLTTPNLSAPSETLGFPQLGLPWALGETQYFTSGPHADNGRSAKRPWSAIDFAGGSSMVLAPADGLVYLKPGCPYVQINHGDGWQTGFYHLSQIAVKHGQMISRGTVLGKQSNAVGCGGRSSGPHVHMTLRLNGQFQDWHGQTIGGWRVQDGALPYAGCLVRMGFERCATSTIYNDGVIGAGDGNLPPPPATPTNTPRPTTTRIARTATNTPSAPTRTPAPRLSPTPAPTNTPGPGVLSVIPEANGVCGFTTLQANAKLPDNVAKLSCFTIPITASGVISELAVTVAMTHSWVSDLRMQLRSPDGQLLTLLNRPGWPINAFGHGSNLSPLYPITFTEHGDYDAEQMGSPDTRRVVCRDDQQCIFAPNADHDKTITAVGLEALVGASSAGDWQICINDNAKGDLGTVASVGLDLHCAVKAEPSDDLCAPVTQISNQVIPDNNSAGLCIDITVPVTATVEDIALELGLDHSYLGDLQARLISPQQTALTLMNRPGLPAARFGDTSNLVSAAPITFADAAPNDPEAMGQQLGGTGVVCRDDLRCRYHPNPNGSSTSAMATHLRDLAGQNGAGVWRVCLSDLSPKDVGRLQHVTLDLTCSASDNPTTIPVVPTATPTSAQTTVTPTLTPSPAATDDALNAPLKAEELDESMPNMLWVPLLTR